MIDRKQAEEIATLLNQQNQLAGAHTADTVLASKAGYLVDLSEDGRVACCAHVKKVQWYQAEISHVTTHPEFVREGRGLRMIAAVENHARANGQRLLQCTIREGNKASKELFAKAGFVQGPTFLNPQTENNVTVWSKPLHPAKEHSNNRE